MQREIVGGFDTMVGCCLLPLINLIRARVRNIMYSLRKPRKQSSKQKKNEVRRKPVYIHKAPASRGSSSTPGRRYESILSNENCRIEAKIESKKKQEDRKRTNKSKGLELGRHQLALATDCLSKHLDRPATQ